MAKSKSKPGDLKKVIGKFMSFRDMKTRKKVVLPVEYIVKYSLAKGKNKKRSKGRCSVMAFAHRGKRRVTRALGIYDCKNVTLTGIRRTKKRSSRKKSRKSSRKHSRKHSRKSSRKHSRKHSRKSSKRKSKRCPKGCTKKSSCKRKH